MRKLIYSTTFEYVDTLKKFIDPSTKIYFYLRLVYVLVAFCMCYQVQSLQHIRSDYDGNNAYVDFLSIILLPFDIPLFLQLDFILFFVVDFWYFFQGLQKNKILKSHLVYLLIYLNFASVYYSAFMDDYAIPMLVNRGLFVGFSPLLNPFSIPLKTLFQHLFQSYRFLLANLGFIILIAYGLFKVIRHFFNKKFTIE
jgi:hypothetical protein